MRKEYSSPEIELIRVQLRNDVLGPSVTEPFTPEETIGEQIFEEEDP